MTKLILKEGKFKKGKFVSNKKPGDIFYKNGFQHTKRRSKKTFLKNGITYCNCSDCGDEYRYNQRSRTPYCDDCRRSRGLRYYYNSKLIKEQVEIMELAETMWSA